MISHGRHGRSSEIAVLVVCLLAGIAFFSSASRLWPLVPGDLAWDVDERHAVARARFQERGWDVTDTTIASYVRAETTTLRWIERRYGRDRAESFVEQGLPLLHYVVVAKREGDPSVHWLWLAPEDAPDGGATTGRLDGWQRSVERDEPGASLEPERAATLAREAVRQLGHDPTEFRERAASSSEQLARRDHSLSFERTVDDVEGGFLERIDVTVSGDEVTRARRYVVVPPQASRDERRAAGPAIALETTGFLAAAVFVIAAFLVALVRIGRGEVSLRRVLIWPSVVFAGLLITNLLDRFTLVASWDPLVARWIGDFQTLFELNVLQIWILLLLVAVVAAGMALDRSESGRPPRGDTLWRFAAGRLTDDGVAAASARGFAVGLLCGGVLTAGVLALEATVGATVELQPRGFFSYTLNSAARPITSLCFFLAVALGEELGYRFFGFNWIFDRTRSRLAAIAIPALVYGLTHTRLDFLPVQEPWWGRALVLTLVGAAWGWAYARYDALTVVLSHFTADLFIFNWPLLVHDRPNVQWTAIATVAMPLVPALLWVARRPFRRKPLS